MRKLLVVLVFALSGCAGMQGEEIHTPAQAVYAAHAAYATALTVALQYTRLPQCTVPKTIVLCSEPNIVGTLIHYDDAAYATLTTARETVRLLSDDDTAARAAADEATKAVMNFSQFAATLKVSE